MERLDNFLKQNGFFESREKAQTAIKSGNVLVNGNVVLKTSFLCNQKDVVVVTGNMNKYVSRGAYKLEKALDFFEIDVKGKNALDIGSSTGGFSDVLLQREINKIVCIDVGKDQLHEKIKTNNKVKVFEQTDFRNIEEDNISDADIIVIDVSFISTKLFIKKINSTFKNVQIVCLVKPQFECGAVLAKKFKGVIKDKNVHLNVLSELINKWNENNFFINNITHSPILGGDGNIEYLFHITRQKRTKQFNLQMLISNAFNLLKN